MFKIGYRVRLTSGLPWIEGMEKGAEYVVEDTRIDRKHGQQLQVCGGDWLHHSHFALVDMGGPIRATKRTEIVSGVYGIVSVAPNGMPMLVPKARVYTSDEMRDAAKLISDLADYIEGQENGDRFR